MLTGFCYDLGLDIVILRIQYLMLDTLSLKHFAEHFGGLDGDGTNQHRLLLGMRFNDILHNSMEFLFFCHIYGIVIIDTRDRTVSRNLNNVHAVDLTELFLFRKGCTGHTGFFVKFVEEVLESNGCQSLGLTAYLYVLLCLNSLMEAIRIATARHDTSGKLVYDQDLVILDHIVLILEHQIVGTQSQDNIVLDLQVFRISQVIDVEEFFHFFHTLFGQVYDLIFLINDKITCLCDLLAHDGSHLGHFSAGFTALQLFCQDIAGLIQLGGFAALTGDDQRCSGFIDQDRVHLIDDGIMQSPLHQLFFIDDHIITQIVKT